MRATVRGRGQITLPREVREALHVGEGDDVAFTIEDGIVTLRGLRAIPAGQAWFWTASWQAGEKQATEELGAGEGGTYDEGAAFLDSLG